MPPSDAAPGNRSGSRRTVATSNAGSLATTNTSAATARSLSTVSCSRVRPVPRRNNAFGKPSRELIPPARTAALVAGAAGVLCVGSAIHERVDLARRGELDLDHPSLAVGVLVHQLGLVHELLVRGDHGAADRRVKVGGCLHRVDHAENGELGDLRTGLRQLHVHNIAELVLRERRDPDPSAVALELEPLVLGGVLQVGWVVGHSSSSERADYTSGSYNSARGVRPTTHTAPARGAKLGSCRSRITSGPSAVR